MDYQKKCARVACDNKPAIYYNIMTKKYYCESCALKINYWSEKDHGILICKEDCKEKS